MGQFLSQRSAHSAGPCSVWLWRLCSCNWCYWICFSFLGLPSGKPPKLFRSSRVQLCLYCPWPWYSTLITQALTKWRGAHPKLRYKWEQLPEGQLLSLGHLCGVLAPLKLLPQSLEARQGGRDQTVRWVGQALSESQQLGFFPSSEGLWARHPISFCLHFFHF